MIKEFKTKEEMLKYGENFSKHQFEAVKLNGKTKILCGTDMAYEEDIWSDIYESLQGNVEKFGLAEDDAEFNDSIVDKASDLRDQVIEWLEDTFNVEFVDVYDEY